MANNGSSSSMQSDQYFAEMLNMMREQGRKDNPITIQIGIMQSANSVKIGDLMLYAEDLYIADYLVSGYSRKLKVPYLSSVNPSTTQDQINLTDGLKKGDLVVVQKLNDTNKYVILVKVVEA